jgi:hypothetical protein
MTEDQEQKLATGLAIALDVAKDIQAMDCRDIKWASDLLLEVAGRFGSLSARQTEYERLELAQQALREGGFAHG